MLKNILSIVVVAVLLSIPAFAKNIQQANLTAEMTCNACKNKVEKALKDTKGVEKVNINLEDKSVKVEYDKDVVSEEQLISAINKADAKFGAKQCDANAKADKSAKVKSTKDGASCSKACQQHGKK